MEVKVNKLWSLVVLSSFVALPLYAAEIRTNTAQMQAMDKVTGKVSLIDVPVNSEVKFGSFSIVVRDCKTRPEEETPENFAFVDVADTAFDGTQMNVFKGWMISSSPALHAVEHPIYDVWLLKCIDTNVSSKKLLSKDELKKRDELPVFVDSQNPTKEPESFASESLIVDDNKPQTEIKTEEIQPDTDLEAVEIVEEPASVSPAEEIVSPSLADVVASTVAEETVNSEGKPQSLLNFSQPTTEGTGLQEPSAEAPVQDPSVPTTNTAPVVAPAVLPIVAPSVDVVTPEVPLQEPVVAPQEPVVPAVIKTETSAPVEEAEEQFFDFSEDSFSEEETEVLNETLQVN